MVHRLSCSEASGVFLDQELNHHLLHQQVDSLPLNHQGGLFGSLFVNFHLRCVEIKTQGPVSLAATHGVTELQRPRDCQCKVSQKEKHKYHILAQIYGI